VSAAACAGSSDERPPGGACLVAAAAWILMPARFTASSSDGWKRESVIASSRATQSRSLSPRSIAMPYSLTTTSRRWRGIVSWA